MPRAQRIPTFASILLAVSASAVAIVSQPAFASDPITATWNGSNGSWSDPTLWSTNPLFPNNDPTTSFTATINNGAVMLDVGASINDLLLSAAGTLAGPSDLTLTLGTLNGAYDVSGTTTIAGGILVFGGSTHNAGALIGTGSIVVTAGATLIADRIAVKSLTINGTATLRPNGSNAVKINTLFLAGNTDAWTGKLDLNDNALILQTTPTSKSSTLATLQNQITSSSNNGWNGPGITSSTLALNATTPHPTLGLALADNATLGLTTFHGQFVDANSLIITQTHLGDSTLDGKVDAFDLNAIASHWQLSSGALWSDGDTTGPNNLPDGKVDAFDLNALATFWQYSDGRGPVSALFPANTGSSVPEPASLALLILGAPLFIRRRALSARIFTSVASTSQRRR